MLGKEANDMSDSDIQALLSQFYDMAEVIANTVYSHGSNKGTKGIDALKNEAQNDPRA